MAEAAGFRFWCFARRKENDLLRGTRRIQVILGGKAAQNRCLLHLKSMKKASIGRKDRGTGFLVTLAQKS